MKMSIKKKEERKSHFFTRQVVEGCIECGKCSRDCRYLQQFGMPGEQARAVDENRFDLRQTFQCSLCGLCTEVCPQEIDPAGMFLALRNEAVVRGVGEFRQHRILKSYERRGNSPLFTWYGLPEGCTTIFFPGCALPGTRPARVVDLYTELRRQIPQLGLVLDCCTKPSHDLGQKGYFKKQFSVLCRTLVEQGIKEVLVACTNCFRMFNDYGAGLEVRTIYEQMADSFTFRHQLTGTVTVHDPCSVRTQKRIHTAVRILITGSGLTIHEMKHHGNNTLCCGEGGAVSYLNKDFSANWGKIRQNEVEGRRIITYCAGCTDFLGKLMDTSHLVDLLFEPEKTLQGQEKSATSPLTYLNRLLLKRRLPGVVQPALEGRRDRDGKIIFESRTGKPTKVSKQKE
jgi:Fe-S oxidoreductase